MCLLGIIFITYTKEHNFSTFTEITFYIQIVFTAECCNMSMPFFPPHHGDFQMVCCIPLALPGTSLTMSRPGITIPRSTQYKETPRKPKFENEILDKFLTVDYQMQHASFAERSNRSFLQCKHTAFSSHLCVSFNFNRIFSSVFQCFTVLSGQRQTNVMYLLCIE